MLRDATHYAQIIASAARAQPAHVPMPAPADHGARWVIHFWPHRDQPPWSPPDDQVSKEVRQVRVNHGRWVVDCPCGGAQLACRTDRRMFCVDCLHTANGGQWVTVAWPDDVEQIEALLESRPVGLQNWDPGETVGVLHAENALLRERDQVRS